MKQNHLPGKPYKVLIVDDEPDACRAIERAISAVVPNTSYAAAATLQDAQARIEEQGPFDLAIIDIRLDPFRRDAPTGIELLGPAKPLCPWLGQTRVIVYTNYPDWETARQAYEAGISTYISKSEPSHTERLQASAKALLELRELGDMWRSSFSAQRAAEEAFLQHHDEWMAQYSGKYVLVRDGQVFKEFPNLADAWAYLGGRPASERVDLGIIRVQSEEQGDEQD